MTDLEMIKKCAERMGVNFSEFDGKLLISEMSDAPCVEYDPLHDDAQAMGLAKKFELSIEHNAECAGWNVCAWNIETEDNDLNRAIVECVAKLQ